MWTEQYVKANRDKKSRSAGSRLYYRVAWCVGWTAQSQSSRWAFVGLHYCESALTVLYWYCSLRYLVFDWFHLLYNVPLVYQVVTQTLRSSCLCWQWSWKAFHKLEWVMSYNHRQIFLRKSWDEKCTSWKVKREQIGKKWSWAHCSRSLFTVSKLP